MPNTAPESDESVELARREAETRERARIAAIEREEIEESRKVFAAAAAYEAELLQKGKRRNAAERSFAEAVEFAKRQIESSGLAGEIRPYYKVRYTVTQGLKAAVHGREDGIATLILQRDILIRLDAIKSLLWVITGLMAFIAYKVA